MRRFLIGFSGAFGAMFLGNIGGLILLLYLMGREVNYDVPGGVLLGFAQAYVAICLVQFFVRGTAIGILRMELFSGRLYY